MAHSPKDLKRLEKANKNKEKVKVLDFAENYIDYMLSIGWRNMILSKKVDSSLKIDVAGLFVEHEDLAKRIKNVYEVAGWDVEYGEYYAYIKLKEKT